MELAKQITKTLLDIKSLAVAVAVGSMITMGAIKAEGAHAFHVPKAGDSESENFAREREVRHMEPELSDGYRLISTTGTGGL